MFSACPACRAAFHTRRSQIETNLGRRVQSQLISVLNPLALYLTPGGAQPRIIEAKELTKWHYQLPRNLFWTTLSPPRSLQHHVSSIRTLSRSSRCIHASGFVFFFDSLVCDTMKNER